MTLEKWIIHPGETRVIDIETVRKLKVGLVGGQIDVIGHDEPGARIEVHGVTIKDLRIEVTGDVVEIDHPQLRWDNFLEVFRNFGAGGPKAEISVAVPREVALNLGVVSASALVSGIRNDARLNTVSGDIIVDGLTGDLTVNAVSGDVQIRELVGALERQQRLGRCRGHRQRSARRRSTPSPARCSSTRRASPPGRTQHRQRQRDRPPRRAAAGELRRPQRQRPRPGRRRRALGQGHRPDDELHRLGRRAQRLVRGRPRQLGLGRHHGAAPRALHPQTPPASAQAAADAEEEW